MRNGKSFPATKNARIGIELMHMIRRGPRLRAGCIELTFSGQF